MTVRLKKTTGETISRSNPSVVHWSDHHPRSSTDLITTKLFVLLNPSAGNLWEQACERSDQQTAAADSKVRIIPLSGHKYSHLVRPAAQPACYRTQCSVMKQPNENGNEVKGREGALLVFTGHQDENTSGFFLMQKPVVYKLLMPYLLMWG